MTSNVFYVYVYFDPTRDLEPFYVGKGKGTRSHCHLTRTDNHPFTKRLQQLARLGILPIIERYENLSEEAAFALEIALIEEIGRNDLGLGPLFNLTSGGDGTSGFKASAETKLKLSIMAKNRPPMSEETKLKMKIARNARAPISDETRAKLSAAGKRRVGIKLKTKKKEKVLKGKRPPMSEETKKKLSEIRKGIKFSEEHKAKISASLLKKRNS